MINLEKRTLFLWGAIFIAFAGLVGVYALGAVPNPGHAISELQLCDDQKILQSIDGDWECVDLPSGSGSSYWIKSGGDLTYTSSSSTTTTVRSLDSSQSGYTGFQIWSGTNIKGIFKLINSLNVLQIGSTSNTALSFIVNGVERMVIDSGGDIEIKQDLIVDGETQIFKPQGTISNGLIICTGGLSNINSETFTCQEPRVRIITTDYDEPHHIYEGDLQTNAVCAALGGAFDTRYSNPDNRVGGSYSSQTLSSNSYIARIGTDGWYSTLQSGQKVLTKVSCIKYLRDPSRYS